MSRRKEPAIPNELLDQLLAGAASAAFEEGGLIDSLKKALTERALNAEMDHHFAAEDGAANMRNGYGRKTVDDRHRQVGDRRAARPPVELRPAVDHQVSTPLSWLR